MTTITRWVLAHRRWVAAFWVVVTVAGIASVGQATKAFSSEFSVPGARAMRPTRRSSACSARVAAPRR